MKKILIVFACDIFILNLILISGCRKLPVEVRTHYGTPGNKYDYLLAAFSSQDLAERESNAIIKKTYQKQSTRCYRVWRSSWQYIFSNYHPDFSKEVKMEIDAALNIDRLDLFTLYLCTNKYPQYIEDIKKAILELETLGVRNSILQTKWDFALTNDIVPTASIPKHSIEEDRSQSGR